MTSSSTGSSRNYADRQEFIRIAVRFEDDSARFYRDMRKAAADRTAGELLALLETQEWKHARILRNYAAKTDLRGGEILQFPPDLSLSMPAPPSESPTFPQLLELAIERERRSEAIYRRGAAQVAGEMKDLLEGLAAFELEHKLRLEAYRDLG